ncbi:helix-turn-helix domain-containing protein [Herbidospora sp. NEAU-GS84]|uniref:Helix-turn-helix domain-containing protein n=1 Tax=Herbidospora solisilvae TaxID=2696284 RepID=A0A7C9J2Q6_9ACTN|nr:helix-turn-helix domain-containing protein [Herbidospora solisilvae]
MPEVRNVGIDDFYRLVGLRIRGARLNAGLSQAELAEHLGLTRSSVANLETGRQRIALHLCVLIAKALSTEVIALLPQESSMNGNEEISDLSARLADSPESAQDFVRAAVAQLGIKHPEGKDG